MTFFPLDNSPPPYATSYDQSVEELNIAFKNWLLPPPPSFVMSNAPFSVGMAPTAKKAARVGGKLKSAPPLLPMVTSKSPEKFHLTESMYHPVPKSEQVVRSLNFSGFSDDRSSSQKRPRSSSIFTFQV